MKNYVKMFESWRMNEEEGTSVDLKKLKIGEFFKLDPKTRVSILKSILEAMVSKGYIESSSKGTLPTDLMNVRTGVNKDETVISIRKGNSSYKLTTSEQFNEKMLDRSIFQLMFVPEQDSKSIVPLFTYIVKKYEEKSNLKGKPWLFDFHNTVPDIETAMHDAYENPLSSDMASKFINSSSSVAVTAQKELEIAMKSSKQKES